LLSGVNRKPCRVSDIKGADIHSLLLECMREWQAKESGFELVIRANLLKIFASILRHWRAEGQALPSATPTDAIRSAIAYIEEHYRTATEREVAAACGISYNHFSTAFKCAMGHSFTAHVMTLKLREAERLLLLSKRSVTEIAAELGFSTTSHFISRFKEARGITPAQFRRRVTVNQSQNGSKI
jgi:AraC-like DNA-binding protein